MSLPVTMYCCTACDFEQGDAGTWGTREYVLGNCVRIPVNSVVGWCESCNGIAPIEDLSINRRIQEYREAQRKLKLAIRRAKSSSLFDSSGRDKSLIHSCEDSMDDAFDALEMLGNRKSPPHCLSCLSTQVHLPKIREGVAEVTSSSPYIYSVGRRGADVSDCPKEGVPLKTILVHPRCGGEIIPRVVDVEEIRIALKPFVLRYTPEGFFIEKVYVEGYSVPDDEYGDDLAKSNRRFREFSL